MEKLIEKWEDKIAKDYENMPEEEARERVKKIIGDVYEKSESGKEKLNYQKLSWKILRKLPIVTLREKAEPMYYYQEGVWKNSPISYVTEMSKRYTEEKITNHQMKELLLQIKSMTYIDNDEFDASPYEINCVNGIYDMITEEFGPHSKKKYIITQIPAEYDPKATCPAFLQFLTEVLDKRDIPTMQKIFGYCLIRHYKFHKMFMLVGEGENGKSTLLEVLRNFIGEENVSNVALQDFETNRFTKIALRGKLANIFADLSSKAMHRTGMFKLLTGEDSVGAEKKFGGFKNFKNYAKLIFSMNRVPDIKEDTIAIWRRILIINFPNRFPPEKADPFILDTLTTPEELSGILNWAIEGYKQLEVERFPKENIDRIREDYIKMSNSLKAFIEEKVEINIDSFITKEEFYNTYSKYCKENNVVVKAKTVVGREINEHLPGVVSERTTILGMRATAWRGIKFKVNIDVIN